jgi:hypothetical protein
MLKPICPLYFDPIFYWIKADKKTRPQDTLSPPVLTAE